jgi:membrane fusion protein, multidrug efflux system
MPQTTGTIKRSRGRMARAGSTVAVVALAALLVAAGRLALDARVSAAPTPAAVAPQTVAVARLEIQDGYTVERAFTGQLQAGQRTALAFELGGTLAEIGVEEGDAVEAGQPIASLDRRLVDAERARLSAARQAVAAQVELAARTSERQAALGQRGVASAQALDTAALGLAELTARLAELDAGLAAVDIRLEKAVITAPFAGRIAARHLDRGGSAGPGQPVVSLVETADPLFRVGLAPDAFLSVPDDRPVDILFDGVAHPARLRSVLPELEAATRTKTVLFRLLGEDLPAYRGTGTLHLTEAVRTAGAWVPLGALDDGPRGLWRLYTVLERDGRSVVGTETVEIIFATAERAFVRGTFQGGALFITDGTHRVVPGQAVRAIGGAG